MNTRKIILVALFIALSFIGANFKVMNSIAFDSMPGFLGALMLGPVYGAIIGAVGHFLTAFTSGFYLSLPVHMIIMVTMAITMYVFGIVYRSLLKRSRTLSIVASSLAAVLINGPITIFLLIPILGKGMLAMIPILSGVAFLNVFIGHSVYKLLPKRLKI